MSDAINPKPGLLAPAASTAATHDFHQTQQWRLAWEKAFLETESAQRDNIAELPGNGRPPRSEPVAAVPQADGGCGADLAQEYAAAVRRAIESAGVGPAPHRMPDHAARGANTAAQSSAPTYATVMSARAATAVAVPPPAATPAPLVLPQRTVAAEPRAIHVFFSGDAVDVVIRDARLRGEALHGVAARVQAVLSQAGLNTAKIIVNGALLWAAPELAPAASVARPHDRIFEINL